MRTAEIVLVIGTRPEAIKLQPVARALDERGLPPLIVLSGQHPLDPSDFSLDPYAILRLDCPGEPDPHAHVRKVMLKLLPVFRQRPALVVVQGDTSTALGGAKAAFASGIPVAHVEAGLRSHDRALPWPEEEYRCTIDEKADLLFAPTAASADNLRREGAPGEIHVTGNTGIDALVNLIAELPELRVNDRARPLLLVTCHRRESWSAGLASIAAALVELAASDEADIDFILHPNAHVASIMRDLLGGRSNIRLIQPCSHRELLGRMRSADLILSDSGGMQEEAPALGVPLLVLRDKTERPEGTATGNMRLVGIDGAAILETTRSLLSDPLALAAMSRRAFPYGDGRAAPRIAAVIERWLSGQDMAARRIA